MSRDVDDKRSRGAPALLAWCMASSWRRALVGLTMGTLSVVWFVTFLASNTGEGSSGSSTLSASAFTISREGSTMLTPSTASPIITEIESDLIIMETPALTKGVKSKDDVSSLEHASRSPRATEEKRSISQPLPADTKGDKEEGKSLDDTPVAAATISSSGNETDSPSIDSSSSSSSEGNEEDDISGDGNDDEEDTATTDVQEEDNGTSQTTIITTTTAQASITTSFPLACPYYDDRPSPFPSSFWYVKNPKTASSTLGGVFRSVAAHHGVEMLNSDKIHMDVPQLKSTIAEVLAAFSSSKAPDPPLGLANHMAFEVAPRDMLKKTGPVMLFTSVREPVSQFHSHYVELCKNDKQRKEPSSICFGPAVKERTAMATAMEPDAQYAYVRGDASDAESAAAQFDFVFVRERLEESLVAFMILYGLDFDDIAHVAAKVRTDRYPGPEELPADLNELVRSKTTKDAKLWAKASMMLDEKIAAIHGHCGGEAYFASMLAAFRSLQEVVMEECTDYRAWYEKHGFSTVLRYWGDNGLAPRCRDFVVRREMRAWQERHVAGVVRAAMAKPREAKAASGPQSEWPALDGWGRPKDA